MPTWLERSAREWIAPASGDAPAGPAAATWTAALGASLVLRACERALARRAGSDPDLAAECEALRTLSARLAAQVDGVEGALPADDAEAHRKAARTFLAACDACFSVLDVTERAVSAVGSDEVADLWAGSGLAAAAAEALAIRVRESMARAEDETLARPEKNRLVAALHEARRARERILAAVESRMVL